MPRPEEIIVDIFRQVRELRDRGERPERVVVSPGVYRALQDYRNSLGELDNADMDYLGKHDIFGVPFYIDGNVSWIVEAGREKKLP